MIRFLMKTLLSAAIVLAIVSTFAAAEERRLDRNGVAALVGGAVALYVLKEALEGRQDRRRVARDPVFEPRQRSHPRFDRHPGVGPRHRRDDARTLPLRCLREFETRRGLVGGFGARCMQRFAPRPRLLPAECIQQVRTFDGPRTFYGPRCLRRAGWSPRTARR